MDKPKFKYMVPLASGLAVVVLLFLSFFSPLVLYLTILVIGGLTIYNAILITNIYKKAVPTDNPEPEEEKAEEPAAPVEAPEEKKKLPDVGEIEKAQKEAFDELDKYIKSNVEKGYKPEQIFPALLSMGYPEELVRTVIAPYVPKEEKPKRRQR